MKDGGPKRCLFASAVVALACLRVCFFRVLTSDEDYHLAAALNVLHGKVPYRDFWYDKPPLAAIYYALIGANPGFPLRLWDAAYVVLCCWLAFRLAKSWWSEHEGLWAAFLMAFFTTFYMPSAVIPFAPDALLLAPHLAAIFLVRQKRWLAAGAMCGLGFWVNVKAVFVAAACALWAPASLAAFACAALLGFAILLPLRAAPAYLFQVWQWGFAYAAGAPVANPTGLALERLGHWLGFHLSLALAWINGMRRNTERLKLTAWLLFSFASTALGNHFAPRYFFQVLPPLVVVGARGMVLATSARRRFVIAFLTCLLLIPLIRFAPRYWLMLRNSPWGDVALDIDSQQAAASINALKRPGDTLFVWGYRPDIYVYTRLLPAGHIWDSQPLTGVAADRHLTASAAHESAATRRAFEELGKPTFIVDGLGPLNANLELGRFAAMRQLLKDYREVARARLSVVYRRKE